MVENKNYSYTELLKLTDALIKKYPFIKKITLSKSCAGREIFALKVGRLKNCSLIAAAFHGSEHITTNIAMYFLSELASALFTDSPLGGIRVTEAFKNCGVIIVPRVNPDGCEISINGAACAGGFSGFVKKASLGDTLHWNANARGIDINHNFAADFQKVKISERRHGILSPGPTKFGGTRPESEPETAALCALCRTVNFKQVLALHTQGEVIYYTFGNKNPRNSEQMAQIMATASNYALDIPKGTAVGGGFKDWFIEEFGRPGFTVEAGLGENPLDIGKAGEIYERIRSMLTLFTIM